MGKYYAVRVGVRPGVYATWDACRQQVEGYSGAIFKKFDTFSEAEVFCNETENEKSKYDPEHMPETYAFVDGSFNPKTEVYGCGGFLVHEGKEYIIQSSGNDPEMARMRNVAGELLGAKKAIYLATQLNALAVTIFYDYSGIEKWATGEWSADKIGTKAYCDFIQSMRKRIKITFVQVPGHCGIEGNEEADRLAKAAVGIEPKQKCAKKEVWGLLANYDSAADIFDPVLTTYPSYEEAYQQMECQLKKISPQSEVNHSLNSVKNTERETRVDIICEDRIYTWKIQRIV